MTLNYGGIRDKIEITEDTFAAMTEHLMAVTATVTERLFRDINLDFADIDGVILVGGSTRMKMVHEYVEKMFGFAPLRGVNPDEAVALGAAIRANLPEAAEGKTAAPLLLLRGAKKVRDVTAHALGTIAISGDGLSYVNSIIIPKHAPIPAEKPSAELELTGAEEMDVYVLQGDKTRPLDNEILHKYVIHDIKPQKNGKARITVTYSYDANGVVRVSAAQINVNPRLPIRIEPMPEDMTWTDREPIKETIGVGAVDVLLTVDVSGSMSGTPLEQAKKAMLDFLDAMKPKGARIGFIPFADNIYVEVPLTDDYDALKNAVDRLEIKNKYGYGNSAQPFSRSFEELRRALGAKYIIVLTDGVWSCQAKAISEAQKCRRENISVIALGFGCADEDFLRRIASADNLAILTDLDNLNREFSRIAQIIG